MRAISVVLLALLSFFATYPSSAQFERTWVISSEPTNERTNNPRNQVGRGWICYGSRGQIRTTCPVTFVLTGIGGPGVTDACIPDANGAIPPQTCGNGGHTHGENDRPLVLAGTQVVYPGDSDPAPLSVVGFSPGSQGLGGFRWTVPQVGGIYTFQSTMLPSLGAVFFLQGAFPDGSLRARGRLNLTIAGDSFRQLPDVPTEYEKKRRGPPPTRTVGADTAHVDSIAYASPPITQAALILIARTFKIATKTLISYNDISLPKGGVFDYRSFEIGNTANRWQAPHKSHREGLGVDVNKPGGVGCDVNTSVQAAIDVFLLPFPGRVPATALDCERANNNAYHINITALKPPPSSTP